MSYDTRSPICSACIRYRPVPGIGPAPSRYLFLGEGPGPLEDIRRLPFIGPSGQELDYTYLPLSGLSRPEVYVTNAIKCRQGKKGGDDPDPAHVRTCALHHLPGELARVRPEVIVTLGAHALRLLRPDLSLEMHHGRPLYNQSWCNWTGTLFPIYHPAGGLRKSEFMIDLFEDFKALRQFRHGELVTPTDSHPHPDYRHLRTLDDFINVHKTARHYQGITSYPYTAEVAIDTETVDGKIWCLTFSLIPGTGYMIRADNHILLRQFREWLYSEHPLVIYHNYLFDAPILSQVGIVTPRWCDTMQEAYQLCNYPQKLKVLAWRYLGMEMQEYEDLITPYAQAEAIGYLHSGSKQVLPEFIAALPWKHKTLRCSGGKDWGGKHTSTAIEFAEPGTITCALCGKPKGSGNMERDKGGRQYIWDRCQSILDDVMGERQSDPIARWEAISGDERRVLEEIIGPMPRPSIERVPFEEAVVYACRDADATLRMKAVIRRAAAAMGRRVRR